MLTSYFVGDVSAAVLKQYENVYATTPPTSASAHPAPPSCPCGEKLICVSFHHQGDHDGTPFPISKSAGQGLPQRRPAKRLRLNDGDQPPGNSRDAEFEVASTSASEETVVPEDFDYFLSRMSKEVSSMQRRLQASRARTTTASSSLTSIVQDPSPLTRPDPTDPYTGLPDDGYEAGSITTNEGGMPPIIPEDTLGAISSVCPQPAVATPTTHSDPGKQQCEDDWGGERLSTQAPSNGKSDVPSPSRSALKIFFQVHISSIHTTPNSRSPLDRLRHHFWVMPVFASVGQTRRNSRVRLAVPLDPFSTECRLAVPGPRVRLQILSGCRFRKQRGRVFSRLIWERIRGLAIRGLAKKRYQNFKRNLVLHSSR